MKSRAIERNRRFNRVAPPTPRRPDRIKIAKGQPRAAASSGDPLARLTRAVATHGHGHVRSVLHRANAEIARFNQDMRERYGSDFVPVLPIHATKKGPGRGTW